MNVEMRVHVLRTFVWGVMFRGSWVCAEGQVLKTKTCTV